MKKLIMVFIFIVTFSSIAFGIEEIMFSQIEGIPTPITPPFLEGNVPDADATPVLLSCTLVNCSTVPFPYCDFEDHALNDNFFQYWISLVPNPGPGYTMTTNLLIQPGGTPNFPGTGISHFYSPSPGAYARIKACIAGGPGCSIFNPNACICTPFSNEILVTACP